jgi:hypothetical protein
MRRHDPLPRPHSGSHLQPRAPVGVMSREEIRHWMRELHTTYGWPWETLARTLGLGEGKHAVSKVRGNSWFRGGEQPRCSRQFDRIISGELVLSKPNKYGRIDAVLADHPVPLSQPARLKFDFASNRLRWVVPRQAPPPMVPSFLSGLARFVKGVEN